MVGYENYKKIGVVYQEELKQIGVNISVEQLEANTWVSDMKSGNFAMSTIVQTMDPDVDFWSTVFMSSAIGGYNFSRLNEADVDKFSGRFRMSGPGTEKRHLLCYREEAV